MANYKTRSESQIYDFDKDFPPCKTFQPSTQLPTVRSVIGMLRYHLDMATGSKSGIVTKDMAVCEVAKQIYAKYYHDTVYCVSLSTIVRKVDDLRKQVTEGKKRAGEKGKEGQKVVIEYKKLFDTKNMLFDVYAVKPDRQKALEEEWGVQMSEREYQYYEDQKTVRKMFCAKGVDPVWYQTIMKAQRVKELEEKYRRERDQQFQYKSITNITEILKQSGEITDSSSDKEQSEHVEQVEHGKEQVEHADEYIEQEDIQHLSEPKRKKRRFMDVVEVDTNDSMPSKFCHIRHSERKVRQEFYITVANLTGLGLSNNEASSAIVEVGNSMFERKWKTFGEYEDTFDIDTAPSHGNIRASLEEIEAQSLCQVVEKLEEQKLTGKMVTHASDSTTKKGVGQFMVQGLHIGQENAFPLPILQIYGETTEDIAMQVDMGFEILALVRGVSVKDV